MDENFSQDYEIIFSDDGSKDNTLKIAQECAKTLKAENKIKIISYENNRGKGCAVRTGVLKASGDIIFFTDCDLAYGLEVIIQGVEFLNQNKSADFLIGSRKKHPEGYAGYTVLRKIMSKIFLSILKIYGGIKYSDLQSGIKGFRKETAQKIFKLCKSDGFSFDFEILLIAQKLKLKGLEMPVKIVNHRESKVRIFRDTARMLRDISVIKKRIRKLSLN